MTDKIAVRGLPRLSAVIFGVVGGAAAAKGLWDSFAGRPEAEFFSREPWQFVTREQWLRFAGFELAFGAACLALGRALWVFSARLPVSRLKNKEE